MMTTKRKFILGGIAAILSSRHMPAISTKGAIGARCIVDGRIGEDPKFSASDYVQGGLIAMWDGIENAGPEVHDNMSETWVDLTGNGNNMIAHSEDVIWFDKNSFVLSSSERRLMTCSSLSYDVINLTTNRGKTFVTGQVKDLHATIEYVVRIDSYPNGNSGLFTMVDRNMSYNNPILRMYNNNVISFTPYYSTTTTLFIPTLGKAYSVSAQGSCMDIMNVQARKTGNEMVNGEILRQYDESVSGGYETTIIMAGPSDRFPAFCDGHIYSIRIYNVALSDEERLYNYMIDKKRFRL